MMLTGTQLADMIAFVMQAHQDHSTIPSKAFRRFDGRSPYGIHPVWAALTFFHEETLDEEVRMRGVKALLGHDLTEDTTVELPSWCQEPDVRALIDALSYNMSEDKFTEVWKRGEEALLLAAYDVTANMLNQTGFTSDERYRKYVHHVQRIIDHVESKWGQLNIVKIARGLLPKTATAQDGSAEHGRFPLFWKRRYV